MPTTEAVAKSQLANASHPMNLPDEFEGTLPKIEGLVEAIASPSLRL
jgi:hypothetical protein